MKKPAILIVIAIILAVIGILALFYNNYLIPKEITATEHKIRQEIDDNAMPKTKVAVIADSQGITKYTELTPEIINAKIKLIEIPTKYVINNPIVDVDLLKGKVAKEDLRMGEQIAADSLTADKKLFGDYDRDKEYTVTSTVAGELTPGSTIDIIVVYGNGDYDVVIPKIKVKKIMSNLPQAQSVANTPINNNNQTNNTQSNNNNTTQNQNQNQNTIPQQQPITVENGQIKQDSTIIVAVRDEEEYRDMEMAKKLGKIETRLYLDENQKPSQKTFQYAEAVKRMALMAIGDKNQSIMSQSQSQSATTSSSNNIKIGQ